MAKYTYENWLNGIEESISKNDFSTEDQIKITAKTSDLIKAKTMDLFEQMKLDYHNFVKDVEEEIALESYIYNYDSVVNSHGRYAGEGEKTIENYCADMRKYNAISMSFPNKPEIPSTLEFNLIIKAMASIEFYNYLIERRELVESDKTDHPIITLSKNQQMLILYYLNRDNKIKLNNIDQDKTKQARVLTGILNRGYHNIYKFLKNPEKYISPQNLNAIIPIFQMAKMDDIIGLINDDLEKIGQ